MVTAFMDIFGWPIASAVGGANFYQSVYTSDCALLHPTSGALPGLCIVRQVFQGLAPPENQLSPLRGLLSESLTVFVIDYH